MKKIFSLLLCMAMLCTMVTCLTGLTASAEATASAKSLVGKQTPALSTTDWTGTAIKDDTNALKPPANEDYVTAETKESYNIGSYFEVAFNFVFGNCENNVYGDVGVIFGTNQIRIKSMGERRNETYYAVVSNSTGTVATATIGNTDDLVKGTYTFTYKNGKLSGTLNGKVINWTVDNSTATSVSVTFDEAATPIKLTIGGNWSIDRYVKDFSFKGAINGDVNFDNKIDTHDLLASQQALLGVEGAVDAAHCDNTYDNVLTSADILSMTHHILGTGVMSHYERPPVNIMCVGDSITAAVGTLSAWRYSFFEKLYGYNVKNFRLVGVYKTKADFRLPDEFRGYSAVGGHTTQDVVNALDSYMAVDFDVYAMMIGTNDADKDITASLANYRTILDRVFETHPNAHVYISSMCPKSNVALNTWVNFGLNPYIPELAKEYAKKGHHITYVDNITGYNWSSADFPVTDPTHPTEQGREKIADAFFNAMKDDVKALDVKTPTFTYTPSVSVEDLTVSDTSITVPVNEAKSVTATVVPANALVNTVLWSSDNEAVATVNANGRITGVSEGTATITAKSLDGGIVKTVDVTVTASTAPKTTQVFADSFDSLNNWTIADTKNTIFKNTAKTCATYFANGKETMTTANTYKFTNNFVLSFEYSSSNNEEAYGDGFYGAVGYAGYEMRVVDCGRKLIIANADGIVATYSTVATINYVKARLVYENNTLTAYYDGEKVLTIDDVTIGSGAYAITYTNGEKWRTTYLDNVYLGTF